MGGVKMALFYPHYSIFCWWTIILNQHEGLCTNNGYRRWGFGYGECGFDSALPPQKWDQIARLPTEHDGPWENDSQCIHSLQIWDLDDQAPFLFGQVFMLFHVSSPFCSWFLQRWIDYQIIPGHAKGCRFGTPQGGKSLRGELQPSYGPFGIYISSLFLATKALITPETARVKCVSFACRKIQKSKFVLSSLPPSLPKMYINIVITKTIVFRCFDPSLI